MSGGGGSRGNGAATIPAASRKMVQSLKEIVNCTEQEIYAMLKECNMDPSESVHRLLSQDAFHEVKSKREKKKETKDTTDSRPRAMNNSSIRGVRGGADRGGRTSSTQNSSNDYGVTHGKPVHKKENGTNTAPTYSIVGSRTAGNNLNRRSTVPSEIGSMESTTQTTGIADGSSLLSQPSSGFQNNWLRLGHVSMADIVKMGRRQGKPFSAPIVANDMTYSSHNPNMSHHSAEHSTTTILPSESDQEFQTSQDPVLQVEEITHELGTAAGQHSPHDDWSLVDEPPAESGLTVQETSGAAAIYADPSTSSTLIVDEVNLHLNPHLDKVQVPERNVNGESIPTESIRSTWGSDRQIQVDNSGDNSHLEDGPLKSMASYQHQRHAFELNEVEDVNVEISSTAANIQQLSLHKEALGAPSSEDNPAVIIPNHLQVTNADCSHLSFGSFGSGISATFSGSFSIKPLKSNLEAAPVADDEPSLDQSDARNSEYYDNGQLKSTVNENVASRTGTSPRSYDVPSVSQPEIIRDDALDATQGLQYNFPSVSGYAFSTATQLSPASYTYPQHNSQMENLNPFSSLMQPYTNSLPSSLLAPPRELVLPFSTLLTNQSMPTKYSTATSSITGPTISMPEVNPGVFSTPQPTPQTLPSTSIPTGGPALPQHLPIHPYSQPTLPLGPFANMISYPFLPQSYTFLPSTAFQQAYTGNSPFHQSAAAAAHSQGIKYTTLPQYKSSSLPPQSASVASVYGGFGPSTNNIPGSFSLHPSTATANTTIGFEEALSSQYKEGSHYHLPPHQSESSAMWLPGAGSRAVSALPPSTYYGFQGQQNQLNSGFRQQQPSNYGTMGYMNYYQAQAGGRPPQEQHQQQNTSEGNLGGSHGLPTSQQSPHQMWQHGY